LTGVGSSALYSYVVRNPVLVETGWCLSIVLEIFHSTQQCLRDVAIGIAKD
jgi:hypothetical protein